jgi:hypothetical protein
MMRRFVWAVLPLALAATEMGALAQDAVPAQDLMVSARDPQGLVDLLEIAGYQPKLETDDYDDPLITIMLDDWNAEMVFYGCDAEEHNECESLQLSAGFAPEASLTPEQLLDISNRFRFASVSLAEDKTIHIQWDIVTGDGIPAKVLLRGLRLYTDTLDSAAKIIFSD